MSERLPGWDAPALVTLANCGCKRGRPGKRVVLCEQRSSEWLALRRGVITASHAGDFMGLKGAPSTSTTRDRYLYELVAEHITGSATERFVSRAMERGQELEAEARVWYSEHIMPVREVGFVWHDPKKRETGGSPDGIAADRLLECKALVPHNHCAKLVKMAAAKDPVKIIDAGHRLQMQFLMWVCGISLCDYLLYSPPILRLPCKIVTVSANASLHAAFDEVVPAFAEEMHKAVAALKETE